MATAAQSIEHLATSHATRYSYDTHTESPAQLHDRLHREFPTEGHTHPMAVSKRDGRALGYLDPTITEWTRGEE